MKLVVTALAVGCLPLSLTAQTGFSSPTGFEKVEGAHDASWLFSRPNQMHQIVEADFRGKARTITGILLRRDSSNVTTPHNLGRTFSNLTIRMANADYQRVTQNFSTNLKGAATTVWSGGYTMPTFTKPPVLQNPAKWGGANGEFRFSFTKGFVYKGTTDFLTEWMTTGGKLANNRSWPTYGDFYTMDGEVVSTALVRVSGLPHPTTTPTCKDPAALGFTGATASSFGTLGNGKITLTSYSYGTAPNAAVLHALGVPKLAGTDIGAKCNKLYMFLFGPPILVPLTSGQSTGYATGNTIIPWNAAFAGLPVMVQAVWSDSKSGRISLSNGSTFRLPKSPPRASLPRRKTVLQQGPIASTPTVFVTADDGAVSPIQFFATK